jgi:peptidylprolyl isomerase
MYNAEAEVLPRSSLGVPERFPFIYSRANDRDAVFISAGIHSDELLPGFEEGIRGMKELGKRKVVVPPSGAWGAEGHIFTNAMVKHVVPPNTTLLFFVELAHLGRGAHEAHEGRHEEL